MNLELLNKHWGIPANIRLDEDVWKTSWRRLSSSSRKTSSRRLQDVLVKTNKFVLAIRLQDVCKTFSRRLAKRSSRHLRDVFKTYHQVKLFLLTRLWEAFNRFLRRSFPKTIIYRGICPSNTTSDKFMVSTKFATEIKICQVLVFQFTAPLVAAFRCVFRTLSNIYSGAFLQKYFKTLSC